MEKLFERVYGLLLGAIVLGFMALVAGVAWMAAVVLWKAAIQ